MLSHPGLTHSSYGRRSRLWTAHSLAAISQDKPLRPTVWCPQPLAYGKDGKG